MKSIFDHISFKSSKIVTHAYSTSFSLCIRFLAKRFHNPVYAVYGFVRLADEIVDSFEGYKKGELLEDFKKDTLKAIDLKISLNPILNSFQAVVHTYQIDSIHIETFLKSMEMDLEVRNYDTNGYEKYILGSAEVIGLMCLRIFMEGNEQGYEALKPYAMKLGSAFQKINFLRDFKEDKEGLGRIYFPLLQSNNLNAETKHEIEMDILADLKTGYEGIHKLPKEVRLGVYLAYIYYSKLLHKIRNLPAQAIIENRIRLSNKRKYFLFLTSYFRHSFNLV